MEKFIGSSKAFILPSNHELGELDLSPIVESLLQCFDVFVTSECIHLYILYCISLYPDVPITRIINIIKSCKFIEVNPPL